MKKKIGIPRSLFYYQLFPFWKTFFEELGAEIVVSDRTTKKILDDGVKSCVDEACLPVKLFHGHVINLKDRVDCLFIPRYTSISRGEYVCPKFGGLPDMIRNSFEELPQIIGTEINLRKSNAAAFKAALEIGSYFCSHKKRIERACHMALKAYGDFVKQGVNGKFPGDLLDGSQPKAVAGSRNGRLNIVVIGHAYNLYDSYINMDLVYKLRCSNANVITVENVSEEIINEKSAQLFKRMFWNFGRKAAGTALHILDRSDIDGVIYLMSFGCGIDSFVCDLVERKLRHSRDIPFTILTIDEHSGEAGLNTRLEAFLDMIRWRKENENYISAHG
ncbi:MAG: acyl-CoA dehydratase activase-related protein [Clostridiales bacterium]|jgi:predicted nucleotide-binding protein (sugar kinase/HSP70/actin superfamily)|nr:acyl-CoA dehydratase activase-related protein [Eubacteriales bacterium]MDH7565592.1 acyl-CoA dehydratase activase-related protein [Clostridiales bacterium]